MANYTSTVVKGAGVLFAASVLSSALMYLIRLVLARKLSQEEFGFFFAVYSVILILNWIKGFGLPSTVQKFIPEFRIKQEFSQIKSVLLLVFIFTLLSSGAMLLIAYLLPSELLNTYFQSHAGKSLLIILLIFILIDGLSQVITSYFIAVHQFFLYSLRELIIRATVLLLIFLLPLSVLTAGWVYVAGALLALFFNFIFFFKLFPFFSYKIALGREQMKALFLFSVPLVARDFIGVIMSYVDNLMLVYFRPLTEVAVYNVILPTADLLLLFGRPFGRIMFPLSSELWAMKDTQQISFLLGKIHKHLFLILAPLYVALFVLAKIILSTFFGQKYAGGALGLQILALGFVFGSLNISCYDVLMGLGKTKQATISIIVVNIINVILNWLLIPFFGQSQQGYVGAALATAFSSIFLFGFLLYYLHRYIRYVFFTRGWFTVLGIALFVLMMNILIIRRLSGIFWPVVAVLAVLVLLYPLLLFLFQVTSWKEFRELLRLVLPKKRETKN